MQLLLSSGIYHGIATHDPKMIDATIDFRDSAKASAKRSSSFRCSMACGAICSDNSRATATT